MNFKSKDLREECIGRLCQIRLEGCRTEPCCPCHYRMTGISGMGLKSPDWLVAWGCDACHTKVDSAERHDLQTQLDFARAVFRTINTLWNEGKIIYASE